LEAHILTAELTGKQLNQAFAMPTKRKSGKTAADSKQPHRTKKTPKKKANGTRRTQLVPVSAKAGTLLPKRKQSSLAAWFEIYR